MLTVDMAHTVTLGKLNIDDRPSVSQGGWLDHDVGLVVRHWVLFNEKALLQAIAHIGDRSLPVSWLLLPKYSNRWIPRRIRSLSKPAPARIEAIQQPDRLPKPGPQRQ